MTQEDVLKATKTSLASTTTAYWATQDRGAKVLLAANIVALDVLATQLDQADLESRAADFETAAQHMKTQVLPGITQLQKFVDTVTAAECYLKTAATDALALSAATGFFHIPTI
jgi:hypothetical protein